MHHENIVIVDAVRSAVGRAHKGSLALTRPDELAGRSFAALLARVPQVKPATSRTSSSAARCPRASRGSTSRASSGLLGGLPIETERP